MPQRILLFAAFVAALTIFLAVPALIASVRKHPERRLIYQLSPLTLLSFILWFVLLTWAVTDVRDDAVISRWVAKLRVTRHLPLAIAVLVLVGMVGSALMVR